MSNDTCGTISLGDDHDCDTCGWTYNELEWEWVDGEYVVRARVGCYGGGEVTTADPDAACAFIADWVSRFPKVTHRAEAEMVVLRSAGGAT